MPSKESRMLQPQCSLASISRNITSTLPIPADSHPYPLEHQDRCPGQARTREPHQPHLHGQCEDRHRKHAGWGTGRTCPGSCDLLSPQGSALLLQHSLGNIYVTLLKLYPTSTGCVLPCKRGNLFVYILRTHTHIHTYIYIYIPNKHFWLAIGLLFLGFHKQVALLSL